MRGLLLVAVLASFGCGKSSAAPPHVTWYDLKSGEAVARHQHKPILVFCYADWSTADKMLDYDTFTALDVRGEMQDFIAIKINLTDDDDPTARLSAERFKVVGVPTLLAIRSLDDYPNHERRNDDSRALFRLNEFETAKELVPKLKAAKKKFYDEL